MPRFWTHSRFEKDTLHLDLQMILDEAIKYVDFTIVEGYRGKDIQNLYYNQGKSQKKFPHSKHNIKPSLAADIVPHIPGKGSDWDDLERFYKVIFFIKGIAYAKGIELRVGADWDGDFYSNDQKLLDVAHIELHKKLVNNEWISY